MPTYEEIMAKKRGQLRQSAPALRATRQPLPILQSVVPCPSCGEPVQIVVRVRQMALDIGTRQRKGGPKKGGPIIGA